VAHSRRHTTQRPPTTLRCEEPAAINTFGSVRQRAAAHLLDLASAQQHPGGADAVGSVREVVARVLREFPA
jgi:CRP/FNR family cyclic AMP-dependent transcriptional regulator